MRGRRLIAWTIACLALLAASAAWATPITWIDWRAPKDGGRVYHANGLKLRFVARPDPGGDAPTPVLTVTGHGLPPLRLEGGSRLRRRGRQRDRRALRPEAIETAPVMVIFLSYSGNVNKSQAVLNGKLNIAAGAPGEPTHSGLSHRRGAGSRPAAFADPAGRAHWLRQ